MRTSLVRRAENRMIYINREESWLLVRSVKRTTRNVGEIQSRLRKLPARVLRFRLKSIPTIRRDIIIFNPTEAAERG